MLQQIMNRDAPDFTRPTVIRPSVINEQIRTAVEVAAPEINHRVKRHSMPSLPEKQQVSRVRRVQIAADQVRVVAPQGLRIGELGERTVD